MFCFPFSALRSAFVEFATSFGGICQEPRVQCGRVSKSSRTAFDSTILALGMPYDVQCADVDWIMKVIICKAELVRSRFVAEWIVRVRHFVT